MSTSIWPNVIAWPAVDVPINTEQLQWVTELRHHRTVTFELDAEKRERTGATLWESRWQGQRVGIGWRWVARGHRVIALADPMDIVTNARLRLSDGQVLDDGFGFVQLNNILHGLPWQDMVIDQSRPRRGGMAALGGLAASERRLGL